MSSFIRSPGLSVRDQNSRLRLFSDEIAEMTLKVYQGYWRWRWHNSVVYVALSVSGL